MCRLQGDRTVRPVLAAEPGVEAAQGSRRRLASRRKRKTSLRCAPPGSTRLRSRLPGAGAVSRWVCPHTSLRPRPPLFDRDRHPPGRRNDRSLPQSASWCRGGIRTRYLTVMSRVLYPVELPKRGAVQESNLLRLSDDRLLRSALVHRAVQQPILFPMPFTERTFHQSTGRVVRRRHNTGLSPIKQDKQKKPWRPHLQGLKTTIKGLRATRKAVRACQWANVWLTFAHRPRTGPCGRTETDRGSVPPAGASCRTCVCQTDTKPLHDPSGARVD